MEDTRPAFASGIDQLFQKYPESREIRLKNHRKGVEVFLSVLKPPTVVNSPHYRVKIVSITPSLTAMPKPPKNLELFLYSGTGHLVLVPKPGQEKVNPKHVATLLDDLFINHQALCKVQASDGRPRVSTTHGHITLSGPR